MTERRLTPSAWMCPWLLLRLPGMSPASPRSEARCENAEAQLVPAGTGQTDCSLQLGEETRRAAPRRRRHTAGLVPAVAALGACGHAPPPESSCVDSRVLPEPAQRLLSTALPRVTTPRSWIYLFEHSLTYFSENQLGQQTPVTQNVRLLLHRHFFFPAKQAPALFTPLNPGCALFLHPHPSGLCTTLSGVFLSGIPRTPLIQITKCTVCAHTQRRWLSVENWPGGPYIRFVLR